VSVSGNWDDRLLQLDPEASAELLDVLSDLVVWELAPAKWTRVGLILDHIVSALASTDLPALREATVELELASPVRMHRIGATDVIPVPESVRDRANHLVHAIRTGQASSDSAPDGAAGFGGGENDERPPD
jgi:hypothetical protein